MPPTTAMPASTGAFLTQNGIQLHTPSSAEYESLRGGWAMSSSFPMVIARPKDASQVAAIVKHCIQDKVPFTVRSGGHDMFGRSTLQDGLTIDMRDINHVEVGSDKKTAAIGGGTQLSTLLSQLAEHKLHATTGTIGTVGVVGWATLGGYGWSTNWAGLGVDQIVAAKVANSEGDLVDADERLLRGLRGTGGNFGVVVEITLKVYPMEEVQSGSLMFKTSELATFLTNYNILAKATPLPPNLAVIPLLFGFPGMGHTFLVSITWRGARTNDFHSWLSKIAALAASAGPPPEEAVKTKTTLEAIEELTALLPPGSHSHMQTVSITHWSQEVIDVVEKHAARVPITNGGFSTHELRACSPSCGDAGQFPDAVFGYRQPHFVIELVASGRNEEEGRETAKWAAEFRDELARTDAALEWSYVPITAPEFAVLDKMYGERVEEVKRLKKELDPKGVFNTAVPRI